MSRPQRIEYPGCWYYVMNRGRKKVEILLFLQGYVTVVTVLQKSSTSYAKRISGHLLIPVQYLFSSALPEQHLSKYIRQSGDMYRLCFYPLGNPVLIPETIFPKELITQGYDQLLRNSVSRSCLEFIEKIILKLKADLHCLISFRLYQHFVF